MPVEPSTVVNPTGKMRKLISAVNDVYQDLWIERDWDWKRREFTSPTLSIGVNRYTGGGWAISRFGTFAHDIPAPHAGDIPYFPFTIYDTAVGVSDEGLLEEVSYERWRVLYARGSQINQRPRNYAISPLGEFCVGPAPDLGTYKINGLQFMKFTAMTADTDTPDLPDDYRQYLPWAAITRLREGDEAPADVIRAAINNAGRIKAAILRNQTGAFVVGGGPIA